jgi:hypothetical protein
VYIFHNVPPFSYKLFLITYQGVPSFDTKVNSYGFDLAPNQTAMEQVNPEIVVIPGNPPPTYQSSNDPAASAVSSPPKVKKTKKKPKSNEPKGVDLERLDIEKYKKLCSDA